jgi:hypothetical protein
MVRRWLLWVLGLLSLAGCPGENKGQDGAPDPDTWWPIIDGVKSRESQRDSRRDLPRGDRKIGTEAGADVGTPYFDDVPPSHPYYAEIQWVRSQDLMIGCSTTPDKFCPQDAATRVQLAVVLVRMKHGASFSYSSTPYFTDVPSTHWAFSYVQRLAADQVTSGCGGGLFCPDDPATRAQLAVMLVKMKYGDAFSFTTTPFFTDVPGTHVAFKYIQKLEDAKIALACGAGIFCPDVNVLRQEVAVFLYRAKTL